MITNPFEYSKPITDPELFIGRQKEIHDVMSRLLSGGQSTSIVGELRIGKTSLLKHLANPAVYSKLGMDPKKYYLLFCDVGGIDTPANFWSTVLDLMKTAIPNPSLHRMIQSLLQKPAINFNDLRKLFEAVHVAGIKLTLLLDEFETITRDEDFDADFFGGLRSLAISESSPLSLVTSTRCDLAQLCHSEEIKNSPFFNIFATVELWPFSAAESEALLASTLKKCRVQFSQEEKWWIYELGGNHPFFLRLAGSIVFDGKQAGLDPAQLNSQLSEQFDHDAAFHFSYFWEQCDDSQKITLLLVLALCQRPDANRRSADANELKETYSRSEHDLRILLRRGLVKETDGRYTLFSPSLSRWILKEIMAEKQESDASFKEWFTTGGLGDMLRGKKRYPGFKKKYWGILQVIKDITMGVTGNAVYEFLIKGMLGGG